MKTVLSFRIFLRTRREVSEHRIFHLRWGANTSFINDGNKYWLGQWILRRHQDETKDLLGNSLKKVRGQTRDFSREKHLCHLCFNCLFSQVIALKVWTLSSNFHKTNFFALILSQMHKEFSRGYMTCSDVIALTANGMCETHLRKELSLIKPDIRVYRNRKNTILPTVFYLKKLFFIKTC